MMDNIDALLDDLKLCVSRTNETFDYYERHYHLSSKILEEIKIDDTINTLAIIGEKLHRLESNIKPENLTKALADLANATLKIVIMIQKEQARLDKQITALSKLKKVAD